MLAKLASSKHIFYSVVLRRLFSCLISFLATESTLCQHRCFEADDCEKLCLEQCGSCFDSVVHGVGGLTICGRLFCRSGRCFASAWVILVTVYMKQAMVVGWDVKEEMLTDSHLAGRRLLPPSPVTPFPLYMHYSYLHIQRRNRSISLVGSYI